MSLAAVAMRELMALGVDGEALIAAVERLLTAAREENAGTLAEAVVAASARADRALLDRGTVGAARTRRWRERKASQSVTERHEASQSVTADPGQESPPKPPKETQPDLPPSPPKGGTSPFRKAPSGAFEKFWEAYPRKAGKGDGRKAFDAAWWKIPGGDPLAVMIQALDVARPGWTDRKFIPHPATWLNGERWTDEPDAPLKPRAPSGPATPEVAAQRIQHYRDTGEWRESWGPPPEVGADLIPFPSDRRVSG